MQFVSPVQYLYSFASFRFVILKFAFGSSLSLVKSGHVGFNIYNLSCCQLSERESVAPRLATSLVSRKAGSMLDPFTPSANGQLMGGSVPAGHRTCWRLCGGPLAVYPMDRDSAPQTFLKASGLKRYRISRTTLGHGLSKVYLALDLHRSRELFFAISQILDRTHEQTVPQRARPSDGPQTTGFHMRFRFSSNYTIFLFFEPYDASLREYVGVHILLQESESKCIMWQILQGIQYLHSMNISHCDLKLENILVRCVQFHPYPAVCIADFDMALYEEDEAPSYPGVCGTISYLPPEAIRAFDNPALRYRRKCGDRWSAGVILFILISGFHPFHCIYLEATKNKILAGLNDSHKWRCLTSAHSLVSTLCHPNPSSRFTAKQALQHRWFKDIGALRSRFRVCSVLGRSV
ncbi:kinase-like domain-containing protein [Mycena olivaceomarginata]|nr:kinase-like domain-containing protein [Mycena olivaceomarginata]